MPPAIFVASAGGDNGGLDRVSVASPAAARSREVMIAIVMVPDAGVIDPGPPDGWEIIATVSNGGTTGYLLRHQVGEFEPERVEFPLDGVPGDTAFGVIVDYRGLNPGAPAVAAAMSPVAPATTNWIAPSQTPTTYSDLVLVAYFCNGTDPGAFTMPLGVTQIGEASSPQGRLAVGAYLPESTGASGPKTATTAVPGSGHAATFVVAANALAGFDKGLSFDPPGAIGLPSEGV